MKKWVFSYAWRPEPHLPQRIDYTLTDEHPLDLLNKWQAKSPEKNYVWVSHARLDKDA